jgi:septal ring factor EnvC (AmiA/AmiB activator)
MGKFSAAIFVWVATMLGIDKDSTESEVHAATEKFKTREDFLDQFRAEVKSELDALKAENEKLKADLVAADAIKSSLEKTIADQTAKIEELGKQPAAAHTTGADAAPVQEANDGSDYRNQGMNAIVRQRYPNRFKTA